MTPTRASLSVLSVACVVVLASCHARSGKSCTLDTDCAEGALCWLYTGTCETPCTQTSDCALGLLCMCEPDRECPEVTDDTPLDDLQGGACRPPPFVDATVDDGPTDTGLDPDTTVPPDTVEVLDTVTDTTDLDCGSDGSPDVLPDGGCAMPSTFPSPTLIKTMLRIGTDGNPGAGLDLDDDPATCSPQPDPLVPDAECSAGIENAMWGLGLLANDYLTTDVEAGSLNVLVELPGWDDDGCVFTMNFYKGTRVPADPPACPAGGEPCDYEIFADSFDASCMANSTIPGAVVSGTHLSAGPSVQPYLFTLVVVGLDLVIPVHEARFEGELTPGAVGPAALSGIIGGWIVHDELMAVFEAILPGEYPFPGKDAVIQLVEDLYLNDIIVNDRDMDGDTVMDAASVGVIIEAVPATIVGIDS